ncbi:MULTISPECIES: hypothetical protein [Pseudomonas]|uniref:Uncharacterized protein n=1 Tax=Pseudomonas flavocrustae TaxID=2991719 RepID=A0ABT6IIC6_9PSED|nr:MULTISPECIES: hypothetical protein [Pseudomonas]MDH4764229.1 hypothetical protein [Pseudomonas sp. CBMAI 2609]HJE68097.1 hypothetical protein [Pseudomonas oryzihabitans]
MSITTALTTMMARQLDKLGYPSDNVRFCLGYCQGDGASFTGTLDIEKLGPRLVPEIPPVIWSELKENADPHEELTLLPGRDRYVHERSTSLSESARSIEGTDAEVYGGPEHKDAFLRFMTALEEDVVSTGAMLARMGYCLTERYPREEVELRVFHLDRFRVELRAFEDDNYNPFEWQTTDDELDERITAVMEGKLQFCALEAKVYLVTGEEEGNDILLAGEHVLGVELPEGRRVCSVGRELIHEAIGTARRYLNSLSIPRLRQTA